MKKSFFLRNVVDYAIITFGAALAAAAIFFFMVPSNAAVGSASGIAMILNNFIPLPISVLNLILNIFFLILGFILIGPEFGVKTIYTSVMIPVFMGIFEFTLPNFESLTHDQTLDVLCYVLLVGIAMAILFSRNASSGGLDIVAKIIGKYTHMELGKAYSFTGLSVAVSSLFFYDTKTAVLSVLGTYFAGFVVDHFIFGMNIKRRVCVISPKLDEIVQYILHDLHSGATLYDGIGAYDNTPRKEVITIVDKNEYRKLMDFIHKTDPKAFVTVYSVSDMRYQPKIIKK